ncbi:MAG: hypothetical protein WC781_00120 [Candidatus Pacearchaeota archaeon]|jgi:hypothetical protein
MDITSFIVSFLIVLLAIPVGYFLKSVTKEEIGIGRLYFQIIWITSLIIAGIMLFIQFNNLAYKYSIIATLIFISIVSFISYYPHGKRKNSNPGNKRT